MRDPYAVLGVSKTAGAKEIKAAFRKAAKRWHPDSNTNDPKASERFAEINHAYEIVGDADKRRRFDAGEIDAEGKPRATGFEGFAQGGAPFGGFGQGAGPDGFRTFDFRTGGGNPGGVEDALRDLFGSAFGARAQRAAGGPGTQAGAGRGRDDSHETRLDAHPTVDDLMRGRTEVMLPDGRTVSVSVPPELRDGQTIRLGGQGRMVIGPDGRPERGDVLVRLHLPRGGRFEPAGADLRTVADLPLATAVKGGRLEVETPDGRLALTVPAWTDSGKVFRLRGKGLPRKAGGHGDLLVEVRIRLPDTGRDRLQAALD